MKATPDPGPRRRPHRLPPGLAGPSSTLVQAVALAVALLLSPVAPAADLPPDAPPGAWVHAVQAARNAWQNETVRGRERRQRQIDAWLDLRDAFPVECDWLLQDARLDPASWLEQPAGPDVLRNLIRHILAEVPGGPELQERLEALGSATGVADEVRWLDLYAAACARRREVRLGTVRERAPRFVFTQRRTIRPSFFAYTEGQSDAQNERHFLPGSRLCLLELTSGAPVVRTLLDDPGGVIRDPAVSWDGDRVVFAWKRSLDDDDYHLYELTVASGRVRQLTHGAGFADYEPAFLPDGDLVFASTRCVQTVDCWWTEVSNLYTCDPDGGHLRRLGFDQVHTVFPQVLDDGRVIYTRWDYNDRGQVFPQPLFQMNPDGTGQGEFYGNNSWFPTTIAHARGIPGTQRVLAILCGHHTSQAGQLAVIDPARGRQENQGVQLVAPVRRTPAERIDAYGQSGPLWQYPYPLNEREFLTGYAPQGWETPRRDPDDAPFGIYWMDLDGRRELLASDPHLASQQPVPLMSRKAPALRPSPVDYSQDTGTYYVQDIHAGPGLAGIPRGTVAKLRVIALEFRPAGIGNNGSQGPGGGALISTPVAIGNGTWDVKVVLGETPVLPDGSACFRVPARTPLYFQAIDTNGFAVQTMRSWSTLQPGEVQACVGCHEHKNTAPPVAAYASLRRERVVPRDLDPFHGPSRGFSFIREVQPILDRHCVRCHDQRDLKPADTRLDLALHRESDPDWQVLFPPSEAAFPAPSALISASAPADARTAEPAFSLRGDARLDRVAQRFWSDAYLNLTLAFPADNDWDRGAYAGAYDGRMVNWIGSQSIPAPLPPYAAGSARSGLFPLLARGHHGARLSRPEWETLACWIDLLVPFCGDYTEAAAWSDAERRKFDRYAEKRRSMEAIELENTRTWQARQRPGS